MRPSIVLLLACALARCEAPDLGETGFSVGIDLKVGGTVRLPDGLSKIRFDAVTQDSRCPVGAMCIWAGDAACRFTFTQSVSKAQLCTLHTTLDSNFVVTDGLSIRLKSLVPAREIDVEVDPGAYVATLEVNNTWRER
jgi:hypothetical protein